MIKQKLTIVTCLLLTTMFTSSVDVTRSSALESGNQDPTKGRSVQSVSESRSGWSLGDYLSRGCSIFIGTVLEIGRLERQAKSEDQTSLPDLKVNIRVDEWLYGEPQQWERQVQLHKVPIGVTHGHELVNDVWRGVKVDVGKRLLIVFLPTTSSSTEDQEPLSKIDRYGLVVSNEKLFQSIRTIVTNHARYVNNPEHMLDAPNLLNIQTDDIFSGYLGSYLYRNGGNENTDTDALLISQLIGNSRVPESYWRLLVGPLVRAMTNDEYPVRESTRNQVTGNLVAAGCSQNAALATSALRALVMLSGDGKVDVKPFLTGNRRQRLIRNYRALITPGSVDKGQDAFESQLGIR